MRLAQTRGVKRHNGQQWVNRGVDDGNRQKLDKESSGSCSVANMRKSRCLAMVEKRLIMMMRCVDDDETITYTNSFILFYIFLS